MELAIRGRMADDQWVSVQQEFAGFEDWTKGVKWQNGIQADNVGLEKREFTWVCAVGIVYDQTLGAIIIEHAYPHTALRFAVNVAKIVLSQPGDARNSASTI